MTIFQRVYRRPLRCQYSVDPTGQVLTERSVVYLHPGRAGISGDPYRGPVYVGHLMETDE